MKNVCTVLKGMVGIIEGQPLDFTKVLSDSWITLVWYIFLYLMALTRKNMSVSRTSSTTPCSGLVGSVTITHPRMIDLTDINSALCLLLEQTF